MRKILLLVMAVASIQLSLEAQPCLPGSTTLSQQEQIDNFQQDYPDCTEILGSLTIHGPDITSLEGLNMIISVEGHLLIEVNPGLTSLNGLESLTTVGEMLRIRANTGLTSLSGLDNLVSTGTNLEIESNDELVSLAGLGTLSNVGKDFFIYDNENLASLDGLESLSGIQQTLSIIDNPALVHLNGLQTLNSVTGIQLWFNETLSNIGGLENTDPAAVSFIEIVFCPLLSTCDIKSICEFIASGTGSLQANSNGPGCNTPEEVKEACDASGVYSRLNSPAVKIHPNPANTTLHIETRPGSQIQEVNIFNALGELILTPTENRERIDVSSLPKGMYMLETTFKGEADNAARVLFMKH